MGKKRFAYAAAVSLVGLAAGQASAELLYATGTVSGASVISRFDSGSLGAAGVVTTPVVGLQAGETLVGIDVRPNSPGTLYGIGSSSRMYTLNPVTGVATQVGTAGAFTLNGTSFGTDFNPVPDAIRQVSNTEQNLRLSPTTGGLLGNDTAINPAGNIVGVAYSNNFPGATTTTLFGIDSVAGTLVSSTAPNTGTFTTVGSLGLGTALNEAIGFDISGATGATAYASITTAGISRLYTINTATGAATLVSSNGGAIGGGTVSYVGLAAASAPEPASLGLLGVVGGMLTLRRRRRV